MKKRKILFFLLLISKVGFGQSSKYSLHVTASPDYYWSDYGVVGPDFSDQQFSARLNYSAGVTTYYQLKGQISLGVGLTYSRKDYQLTYNYRAIAKEDPLLPITTIIRPAYLELPIKVQYTFVRLPKFAVIATTGFTPSFLLQTSGKTTYGDGHTRTGEYARTKANTCLLSLPLSVGATYKLNSLIGLVVQPEFRYYFNKIDNQAFEANPKQISLQVGTVVHF